MRVATMISLGASALLGVGALFVARVWLPSTVDGAGPAAVSRPAADTPVVVAAEALPYGTRLEAKHLTISRLPASAVPEGAFATVAQVLSVDGGAPVVLTPVGAREAVLPFKISGPGARASVAAMIAPGMRAYALRVSDVTGVGGHGLPGDRVDVLLTRDLSGDSGQARLVSDVVVQNVRLLGVDLNADPTSNTPAEPKTATVEVSVEDAQKLSVAASLGQLSLALRRNGASETAAVQPVVAQDLGAVGASVRTANLAPAAVVPPPPPPPPVLQPLAAPAPAPRQPRPRAPARPVARNGSSIVVVHGETAHEVVVASEWGA
ncbi:MAG: Flp pilus assembly protein CpaB [Proteobacteria bacterium]|nr:Flp pilus assembly protein CpaB [Pseudomonadota bacterium]